MLVLAKTYNRWFLGGKIVSFQLEDVKRIETIDSIFYLNYATKVYFKDGSTLLLEFIKPEKWLTAFNVFKEESEVTVDEKLKKRSNKKRKT
jgi:hypothetical protein